MTGSWTYDLDARRVAWLVCDTPGTSTNVLSAAVLTDLSAALTEIAASRPTGLVLRSAKPNGFIAGADIKEFLKVTTPEEGYALVRAGQAVLDQLEALPCPSAAALHGFVLGGGLELALACTYRVGADDPKLSLGLPEVMLGIHPGFGGTVRSVRLLGVRAALDLMLKGKPLNGQRALSLGLLDRRVPQAELLRSAEDLLHRATPRRAPSLVDRLLNLPPVRPFLASRIAATLGHKVARDHYPAPYAILNLWRRHGAVGSASYDAEARSISTLMCTATSRNLVRVFLLQDRLKSLGGRISVDFKHVHVVGAGIMGGDIAALSALRGMTVTLQDRSEELVQPALERARAYFDKRLKDPQAAADAMARLRMDVAGGGAAIADVVIEAIVEKLEIKRALLAELEPRMKTDAVLATNTSSLEIESLAEGLPQPARLVGIHFFNPVAQMQLVEIVAGRDTDERVVQTAMAFTRRLDKLPLPCRSSPGFVVNRILMPYINEALFALADGIPAEVIDRVGTRFGMPVGPIELADVVGLDVCLQVGRVLGEAFQRSAPGQLQTLVEQGKLGRKTGEGFYTWREGKPVRKPSPGATVPADLEDLEDLEDRLMLPMLNEAVATLRENVIADTDLLDAGVIFATGFAPFRGGPLAYAKSRGVGEVVRRLGELEKRYGGRFHPDPGWQTLTNVT
jgi:3-hydroxyacyl-CoA dehydrogenase/enoyl-CoA hydratase/3-hydroxybutyryl-CoA epimerase